MKKRKLYFLLCISIFGGSSVINAQTEITDHEENIYEVAKLADGRNWMMEGLRVKTDRDGNSIEYYWNDHNGTQSEAAAAARYGYAYPVESLFGAPSKKYPDIPTRAQGLCPDGYYVPEWWDDGSTSAEGDWQRLIRAYNGVPTWWDEQANWIDFMNALRISFGDGTTVATGSANGDPGKFNLSPDNQIIITGWSHMHTSGPVIYDKFLWLNLPTSSPTSTAAGYEFADEAAHATYCRCVENFKVNVTFQDFDDISIMVRLSDSLRWNSYAEDEQFTRICAENFYIENADTKEAIEILDVQPSADAKSFQIFGEFATDQIYELKILDARLNEKMIAIGGYTFNNGAKLYFPHAPSDIKQLEYNADISIAEDILYINTDRTVNARIYNTTGIEVMTIDNLSGYSQTNISMLNPGIYIVQLQEISGSQQVVRKFAR